MRSLTRLTLAAVTLAVASAGLATTSASAAPARPMSAITCPSHPKAKGKDTSGNEDYWTITVTCNPRHRLVRAAAKCINSPPVKDKWAVPGKWVSKVGATSRTHCSSFAKGLDPQGFTYANSRTSAHHFISLGKDIIIFAKPQVRLDAARPVAAARLTCHVVVKTAAHLQLQGDSFSAEIERNSCGQPVRSAALCETGIAKISYHWAFGHVRYGLHKTSTSHCGFESLAITRGGWERKRTPPVAYSRAHWLFTRTYSHKAESAQPQVRLDAARRVTCHRAAHGKPGHATYTLHVTTDYCGTAKHSPGQQIRAAAHCTNLIGGGAMEVHGGIVRKPGPSDTDCYDAGSHWQSWGWQWRNPPTARLKAGPWHYVAIKKAS
jgi:hypothetical protein